MLLREASLVCFCDTAKTHFRLQSGWLYSSAMDQSSGKFGDRGFSRVLFHDLGVRKLNRCSLSKWRKKTEG